MKTEVLVDLFKKIGLFNITTDQHVEPQTPMRKKEKVLGDMNELEKNCFALVQQIEQEHDEIHKKFETPGLSDEEKEKAENRHAEILQIKETVLEVMWLSIKTRGLFLPTEATGYGVRKGFNVVAMFEQENNDLFKGMPGMMIVAVGAH